MTIKLYHCTRARSMRPLWTLEEMGIDYDLEVMPFPPRFLHREFLDVNPLGTIPCMIDGDVFMTESAGICQYLVDKYGPTPLRIEPDEPDYGSYLNWLHHCDATLTFPQTLVLRYTRLEPEEKRIPQVANDYRRWFLSRLKLLDRTVADREFLCGGRFTIADICIGYALVLAESLDIQDDFPDNVKAYFARLKEIPSYQRSFDI